MITDSVRADTAEKIAPLQGLRAVAALAIAFAHLHHVFARQTGTISFGSFSFAVDVFFVISGFIMLFKEYDSFGRRQEPKRFILRRLARIAPLYFLISLIYLYYVLRIPGLPMANLTWDVVWKSFLFIPAARPQAGPHGSVQPLLDVGWTLNFEMFFYVCFAMALYLPRAYGLLALFISFCLLNIADSLFALPAPIAFWASLHLFEFVSGMVLAAILRSSPSSAMPTWACASLIGAGLALWMLFLPEPSANLTLACFAATLVVAGTIWYRKPLPSLVSRLMLVLGSASYAIYLIHPMTYYYTPWFFGLDIPEHSWSYMWFALTVVVLLSIPVHGLFERPLNRWLTRSLRRSEPREAAAQTRME